MIKADKYLKETISEILEFGALDVDPRPKWGDGTPAHTKFVTQKVFEYDISRGEFPINTLRTTALKGAFYDIEAIYIDQTTVVKNMNPSIWSWWKDFADKSGNLGNTYGHTVDRYDLMDKLLDGLEKNPFGRRHKISLWQEQQVIDDPRALEPCAGLTMWTVREKDYSTFYNVCLDNIEKLMPPFETPLEREREKFFVRSIDLTLVQRSMDLAVTSSINPVQYVEFGMAVCNHLTFKTGIKHEIGKFLHLVQNCHIYDRHLEAAKELLSRESTGIQPKIELVCEPKDFYSHTVEDFKITGLEGIKGLDSKLEIAV
jgi:thymidylate synthase